LTGAASHRPSGPHERRRSPGASPTPAEIRAFRREPLAPYKVPAKVTFVKELPKSTIGKVLRRKLRELDASPPDAE
jgi:acyl-coenzyme A synthetase/AMP-(fatty) acid ligase